MLCPLIGESVYIATRFFDRRADLSPLMPGFLLALLECRHLQLRGCGQWDLGTANRCPLMRYKKDLTGPPITRPIALFEFESAKKCFDDAMRTRARRDGDKDALMIPSDRTALSIDFSSGTIIESVSLSDLLQHI